MEQAETPRRMTSLWRNRDYMLLWSGQVVSTLGSSISMIVIPLLILALTESPAAAGFAGLLLTAPYVVFSLPAGALVDRWDRKRVMILCDVGRALAFFSIPVALAFDLLTVWQLYVVSLIEGTLFVFFNIAEVAALPKVVEKKQLGDATAMNMSAFAAASLIGPAVGGFLYQSIGPGVPFLLHASGLAVSVFTLWLIRTRFQDEQVAGATRHMGKEIREGLAWMWNEPLVRFTSFLSGALNFAFAGSYLIVIVLAKGLGASETAIGTIFSVGAIGGIIGAAIGGRINRKFAIGRIVLVTTWLNVLVFPLIAVAPHILLLGIIASVLFFATPVYSVAVLSYRLALIPDALQGRVNSAVRLVAFGFQPLGSMLAGLLLENVGPVPAVAVFSVWLLGWGLLLAFNPGVRNAGTGKEATPLVEEVTPAA